jgi:prepilin peptidase CpaA
MSELIPAAIAVALAAMGALTDWRTGTIPNWLTLPPLLLAPVVYLAVYGGGAALGSLVGAFICFLGPYTMFRCNALGGGDVKLFAAIGAVAGLMIGLEGQLFGLIIAALYALVLTTLRGGLFRLLRNSFFLMVNRLIPATWRRTVEPEQMTTLRLGGFILAGICLSITLRFPGSWS